MGLRLLVRIGLFMLLTLLAASLTIAQQIGSLSVNGEVYQPPQKAAPRFAKGDLPSRTASLATLRVLALASVDRTALERPNAHGQVPIGISRGLDGGVMLGGGWDLLPGGKRVWRLALRSPGAEAVRVHFQEFNAGTGRVWVYGSGEEIEEAFTGAGTFGDGNFWTGSIAGDTAFIEYASDSLEPEDIPPFRVVALSHAWEPLLGLADSKTARLAARSMREVAPCHSDFKCDPAWGNSGSAVAHIIFMDDADGLAYNCSGTLLNSTGEPKQPYFLTAAHCVDSDSEARSMESYWKYESPNCNGPGPSGPVGLPRVIGARLLATTGSLQSGDSSLLVLSGFPQTQVFLAGWASAPVSPGLPVVGIHHPNGSFKRISYGTAHNALPRFVEGVPIQREKYFDTAWREGRTEKGSSGSAVFNSDQQVVGVLSLGPNPPPGLTVCQSEPYGVYGRFSDFFPSVQRFLSGDPVPTITVNPSELRFNGVLGGSVGPSSASFQIRSDSASPLTFNASSGQSWIRLSPASGAVSAANAASLQVSIDQAAFTTMGTFNGFVAVQAGSAALQSVAVRVTMTAARSAVTLEAAPNPVYESAPNSIGQKWFYELRLRETAGVATVVRQIKINDSDLSNRIASWFGTNQLPALGSLSVQLGTPGRTPPFEDTVEISGADNATGQAWSRRVVVRFLGPRQQAAPTLTILPSVVARNPASGDCPWRHEVELKETGGAGMHVSRWLAGGHDLSADITGWFGSSRLGPNGTLRTTICWTSLSVPTTLTLEVRGQDDRGNQLTASTQAQFVGAGSQQTTLAVTPARVDWSATPGSASPLTTDLRMTLNSVTAPWAARVEFQSGLREWLSVSPLSGTGAAAIAIRGSATSLAVGVYQATLSIESPFAIPPRIVIPIQLQVTGASADLPRISSGGVVNGANFLPGLSSGSWMTIRGTNLAATTRTWRESDFAGARLPTQLDDVSVSVGGHGAYISYVSPTQINALVPDIGIEGEVSVRVLNPRGGTETVFAEMKRFTPAFFMVGSYVAAVHPDGSVVGRFGLSGLAGRPAKPGDTVLVFGTGFGRAVGQAPIGDIQTKPGELVGRVKVFIGGAEARVDYAGLIGAGLYQFNVVIPDVINGELPVEAEVEGFRAQARALIAIQK